MAGMVRSLFLLTIFLVCSALVHNLEYDPDKIPLRLEGGIQNDSKIYPSQRFSVYYRIYYHGDISLTQEDLPLLNIAEMKKIGGVQVSEGEEGAYHYQEFVQVYEKNKEGKIQVGASHVKGIAKLENRERNVEVELPAKTITVLPFPEIGKPPAFNGAIGPQSMQVSLEGSSSVGEGDLMQLKIAVSSPEHPSTIHYPDIACQSGFSGFYQIGEFSSHVESSGSSVTFGVDVRPLSASVTEIAPIQYVYFNPRNQQYEKLISKAIPIQVKPIQEPLEEVKELAIETDWKNYLSGAQEEEERLNSDLQSSEKAQNDEKLGDIYFKLREYPFAAYHYYKHSLQHPEGEKKLEQVLAKLQVKKIEMGSTNRPWVFYLGLCGLLFSVIFILCKKKSFAVMGGVLTAALLILSCVQYYQRPLVGLLVEAAVMHQMPDERSPYVRELPLKEGEGVQILGIDKGRSWVKIKTGVGKVGYVPIEKVRAL